jgi:glycerate 2-kinase
MRIRNSDDLTSHGNTAGRAALVDILEAGLQAADPYQNTRELVRVDNGRLIVGGSRFEPAGSPVSGEEVFELSRLGRILVLGAGKGLQRVAKALEDVLGERLTGGHIIDKKGHPVILERIEVTLGGHPVPDDDCVKGCRRILELTQGLTRNDLVFTCIGNGVSALLTLPVPGVSLEDVKATTRIMQIEHGAPTPDLNPVRNHLDMLKGGRIARLLQPAHVIDLVAIEPGDYRELMHENFWLHTLPDGTTYDMAIDSLHKWGAWDEVPESVRRFLAARDDAADTVKAEEYERMGHRIFGVMPGPRQTAKLPAAMQKARELGYQPYLLGEEVSAIEASQAAAYLSEVARTIERRGQPFESPCALFTSGEMVVTVGKCGGMGGRNQEFALAAARRIAGSTRIVMASVDTDGTDGPGTQFTSGKQTLPCLAGGIVDGFTAREAPAAGVDISDALRRHDATPALWRLRCGILAEPSISLNDMTVALIMGES